MNCESDEEELEPTGEETPEVERKETTFEEVGLPLESKATGLSHKAAGPAHKAAGLLHKAADLPPKAAGLPHKVADCPFKAAGLPIGAEVFPFASGLPLQTNLPFGAAGGPLEEADVPDPIEGKHNYYTRIFLLIAFL